MSVSDSSEFRNRRLATVRSPIGPVFEVHATDGAARAGVL